MKDWKDNNSDPIKDIERAQEMFNNPDPDIDPKIYVGPNMKNYLEEQGYLAKPEKEMCLFDLVEDKTVPIGLSCFCPKCSFR